MKHICKLVKGSTTLKGVVFFKPSKDSKLMDCISKWGNLKFQCTISRYAQVRVRGRQHSVSIYANANLASSTNRTRPTGRPMQPKKMLTEEAI